MPKLPKIVIADSSCLISLINIGELDLLRKIYAKITITIEIKKEIGEHLPNWIEVSKVNDSQKINLLELELDRGEASAIALALESGNCLLVIDEKKGRRIAKRMGLKIIGTLGIVIQAKIMRPCGFTNNQYHCRFIIIRECANR